MIPGGSTAVHGELYKVGPELLARLDRHEGVPRLYVRETLSLVDGVTVDGYFLIDVGRILQGTVIENGTWNTYENK